LIKSKVVIAEIKNSSINNESKDMFGHDILGSLFNQYDNTYGLERLAEIFFRFKPIFLAFRGNESVRKMINKIRKLANDFHKPMPEDYLNSITGKLNRGINIDTDKLNSELDRVNIFRKIRLANALMFRNNEHANIMYRIRNGKAYVSDFKYEGFNPRGILCIVEDSIIRSLRPKVENKIIYIPDYMQYTLPATEKQFICNIPVGSYISVDSDLIVGVHWENTNRSIDLDLAAMDISGKIGWDSNYRNSNATIMFSGDLTDARKPKGATELLYVSGKGVNNSLVTLNYYNFVDKDPVPFKLFIASEKIDKLDRNFMVNPNNVIMALNSTIDIKQKTLGLIVVNSKGSKFCFAESTIGNSITARVKDKYLSKARQYLLETLDNNLSLNEMLARSGAIIINYKDNACDIDLSPENLEKDTILKLLV
jgi:hypothetical protein